MPMEVDSMKVKYSPVTYSVIQGDMFVIPPISASISPIGLNLNTNLYNFSDDTPFKIPSYAFLPGQSNLFSWSNGAIMATGADKDMPGLMHMNQGAITLFQNYGPISLNTGVIANKYGYYQGVHTQYGIMGNISYHISPSLSLTAYGTYFMGNVPTMNGGLPLPPGMLGYYQRSTFGGYFNYRFNKRYGILVGGQAVQQTGTHDYKFEPVVTPYFKVGKIDIGLPVGQILNGIIRDQIERRRNNKQFQGQPPRR